MMPFFWYLCNFICCKNHCDCHFIFISKICFMLPLFLRINSFCCLYHSKSSSINCNYVCSMHPFTRYFKTNLCKQHGNSITLIILNIWIMKILFWRNLSIHCILHGFCISIFIFLICHLK